MGKSEDEWQEEEGKDGIGKVASREKVVGSRMVCRGNVM